MCWQPQRSSSGQLPRLEREECAAWSSPAKLSVSQRHRESREVTPELSTAQSASVLHETFLHGDRTIFMNIKISKKEIAVIEIVPQI